MIESTPGYHLTGALWKIAIFAESLVVRAPECLFFLMELLLRGNQSGSH